jgi:hypothetical protein
MTTARATLLLLSCFLLVACKGKDGDAAAEGGAAAAKGPACPTGTYADPKGRFCMKLAAGYKAGEEKTGTGYPSIPIVKDGSTTGITLWLAPLDVFDIQLKARGSMAAEKNNTSVDKADIADGKGKFWRYKITQVNRESVQAVVKGPQNTLMCEAGWFDSDPKPEIADMCKSLTVPK